MTDQHGDSYRGSNIYQKVALSNFSAIPQGQNTHSNLVNGDLVERMKDFFRTVVSSWKLLLLWVLIVFSAALAYLWSTPATYSSDASVLLEPRLRNASVTDPTGSNNSTMLDSFQADSQIQVIKSERLLRSVFNNLNLAATSELSDARPSNLSKLLSITQMLSPWRQDSTVKEESNPDSKYARAFGNFIRRVNARRIGQSYVIEISYYSNSAETSARLANSIAMQYLEQQIAAKAAIAQNGNEYLQGRLVKFNAELEAARQGIRNGEIPDVEFPDADARVISSALAPSSRVFPQRGLTLSFALVFGFASGLIVILVRNGLDQTIRSARQLYRINEIPCVTTVSLGLTRRQHRILERNSADLWKIGKAKQLTRALAKGAHDVWNISSQFKNSRSRESIAFVSIGRSLYRSEIAKRYAELMVELGSNVTIVDADTVEARITKYLKNKQTYPNSNDEFNYGDRKSGEINNSSGERLDLISLSEIEQSRDLEFPIGLADLKDQILEFEGSRNIVVDLPDLMISQDFRALRPIVDGVFLIIEARIDTMEALEFALAALRSAHLPLYGLILINARQQI